MAPWVIQLLQVFLAIILVVINGFFVAAEFALVKVRLGRIEQLIANGRMFSKTAKWLAQRLEKSLSACQLGITMASLALGWVGEPAFAKLLEPLLHSVGVQSEVAIHAIAFVFAFSVITSLHLVLGEQAPKIFAIRQPEKMLLWCALPLKIFYIMAYPFMAALDASTAWILGLIGLKNEDGHSIPYNEEEIRALLREAHIHGNLTGSEHSLLDAVFEFDDAIARRIMLPRTDIEFVDIGESVASNMELIRRTKHTRYPLCDGSLDDLLGVIHVKDLTGITPDESFDWKSIVRPPKKVPENMPVRKLLRHFQGTHQLMAFVIDEYGTNIGIVTLENVLEEIIGNVADEFDSEEPDIIPDGPGAFVVQGSTSIEDLESKLDICFGVDDVDTVTGLLMHETERMLTAGEVVQFDAAQAKILEVADDRAVRVRFEVLNQDHDESRDS